MPRGEEAAEGRLLGGLDLAPQHRQRRAPDPAQDVGVAPLALRATGAELAAHELVGPLERRELTVDASLVEVESRHELGRRERPVRPRVPAQQLPQRMLDRLEEHLRDAARRCGAEGVADEAGVLDRGEQLELAEADPNRTALADERLREPAVVLAVEQGPGAAQEVVQLVDVSRRRTKRRLDLLDGAEVEELAELLDAHQLSEQIAVERQRLRTPLLGRRVVLVHVRRDVVEEERRRERRRRRRLDLDEVERALPDPAQDLVERGQVEDVLQALAVRLEHDRELRVPARDLQQALRLQALLPERRALSGTTAGDEERAGGVLPEAGAVQRRLRELARAGAPRPRPGSRARSASGGGTSASGKWSAIPSSDHNDWTSRPSESRRRARKRHRPRRVHATAVRRKDADAPVPDLVAEALDDDRPVGRDDAGRGLLLAQERDEIPRGQRVEAVVLLDPCDRRVVGESRQLARGPADLLAELGGPPHSLALPERSDARHARRRRHDAPDRA